MTRRRAARRSAARTAAPSVSDSGTRRTLSAAPGPVEQESVRACDQQEAEDTTELEEEQIVGDGGISPLVTTECKRDRRSNNREEDIDTPTPGIAAGNASLFVPEIQVDAGQSQVAGKDKSESPGFVPAKDEDVYAPETIAHGVGLADSRLAASTLGSSRAPASRLPPDDHLGRSPLAKAYLADHQSSELSRGQILDALWKIREQGPQTANSSPMAFPAVGQPGRPSQATSDAAYPSSFSGYPDSSHQQSYPSASTSMDPHGNGGDRPNSGSHQNGGSGQSADGSASGAGKSPSALGGGKIFKCMGFANCDMTFTRSEHLARHVRKHTGERPFPCHCHKSFSRLDNLRQHAATVHSDQQELNERMLRALAPVHAALSQRAGKEQKKRGEVLELPKPPSEKRNGRASMSHAPGMTTALQGGPGDRPGSSSGGVIYNGQGYGWQHAQGAMIPPQQAGMQQDMKGRMNSVGSGWDSATTAEYGRPGTAQTLEPPRSSHGVMGAPPSVGQPPNRIQDPSAPQRPTTANSVNAQRFSREAGGSPAMPPQVSRPMTASEGHFNPFPYGIRPGGGQDNASARGSIGQASTGHGRTMSDAGAMASGSGGYAGPPQNGLHGAQEQQMGPGWQQAGQTYAPPMSSGSQHYAPTGPPYSAAYTEDSYGPAPPATAPSVYHFGSAQTPARFAGDEQIAQAFHGQYSGSSGHTSSRGGSNASSGPRQGGIANHVSQAQINELYGNPNSGNQESPFSYHPPPTATGVPPPFPGNAAGQPLANYPVSPSSPGSISRKRPVSSRGGPEYGGALPPNKMARTDGQPFDPNQPISAPSELWFPARSERRSSLAISSLLADPATGSHDGKADWHSSAQTTATLAPGHGASMGEVYSDYAYDGRATNVQPGWTGNHQQAYVADYGEHDGRHQHQQLIDMDAKAKALLAQQYEG